MPGGRAEDGRGGAAVGASRVDGAGDVCEGGSVVVRVSGKGIRHGKMAVGARGGLG